MKKRSLIASIAMLLVSAIVLSTSTYAWFSAGAAVSVESVTAQITSSDGSIEISADGTNYQNTQLTLSQLQGVASYAVPGSTAGTPVSALSTVSANPGTGTLSMVPGSLRNDGGTQKITSAASAAQVSSGKFVFYQFYVRTTGSAGNVNITPTFTVSGNKNFVLGAVVVNNTIHYFGKTATTYYPLKTGATDVVDTNGDSVLDATEGGSNVDSQVTVATSGAFTGVDASSAVCVDVYIWAEGQEATCTGSVSALQGAFSFDIETA